MKFVAFERTQQGTGASRRLRTAGKVPGVVLDAGTGPDFEQHVGGHALGKRLDGFRLHHAAAGIVGRVEDDGLGLVAEGLDQCLLVKMPVRFVKRNESRLRITEDGIRPIVFIKRFEDNHLFAGIDDCH